MTGSLEDVSAREGYWMLGWAPRCLAASMGAGHALKVRLALTRGVCLRVLLYRVVVCVALQRCGCWWCRCFVFPVQGVTVLRAR